MMITTVMFPTGTIATVCTEKIVFSLMSYILVLFLKKSNFSRPPPVFSFIFATFNVPKSGTK